MTNNPKNHRLRTLRTLRTFSNDVHARSHTHAERAYPNKCAKVRNVRTSALQPTADRVKTQ